jgi:hypothetical protein
MWWRWDTRQPAGHIAAPIGSDAAALEAWATKRFLEVRSGA